MSTSTGPPTVRAVPPRAPEPEFSVISASARRHAAVPALEFDVTTTEPGGHQVFAIALSAQVLIEPARRTYDADTHERLVELFGPPERWGATTRSLVWDHVATLVGSFVGSTTFRLPVACSFDLELAAAKFFYSLPGGEVPLAFNFNGTIYYRGSDGRLQMSLVPWSASAEFRLPVATWRELMEHHYPGGAWAPLQTGTLDAVLREKARRGLPTIDACVRALLEQST